MKPNFREMFEDYLPEEILSAFAECEILKIDIGEDKPIISLEAAFSELPSLSLMLQTEQILSKILSKHVRFSPRFAPELFSNSATQYVLDELKFRGKTVNGFFTGATSHLSGDTLTISLSHGGKEILERNFCPQEISEIIREWFSKSVTVVLEEDPDAAPVEKVYEENIVYRNAPPTPPPPKPKFNGYFNMAYTEEGAETILGKVAIKNSPNPIANLDFNTTMCCVWGDVFFKDSREIKNGESTIFTFYISDGTDSVTLKSFVKKDDESKIPSIKEGDTLVVEGVALLNRGNFALIILFDKRFKRY